MLFSAWKCLDDWSIVGSFLVRLLLQNQVVTRLVVVVLDTHFLGFKNLGAHFGRVEDRDVYEIQADKLVGTYMLLDEASITGTANITWQQCWQKEQQQFTTQLVSLISSNSVRCLMQWVQRLAVLPAT